MCRCYVSPDGATIEREFALGSMGWKFAANFNTTPAQVDSGYSRQSRQNCRRHDALGTRRGRAASMRRSRRWRAALTFASLGNEDAAALFRHWDSLNGMSIRTQVSSHTIFTRMTKMCSASLDCGHDSSADANTVTECCSIITLPANALISQIHNSGQRMPALLTREQRELWLLGTCGFRRYGACGLCRRAVVGLCREQSNQFASQQRRKPRRTPRNRRRLRDRPLGAPAGRFARPAGGFLMQVPSVKHLPG